MSRKEHKTSATDFSYRPPKHGFAASLKTQITAYPTGCTELESKRKTEQNQKEALALYCRKIFPMSDFKVIVAHTKKFV